MTTGTDGLTCSPKHACEYHLYNYKKKKILAFFAAIAAHPASRMYVINILYINFIMIIDNSLVNHLNHLIIILISIYMASI